MCCWRDIDVPEQRRWGGPQEPGRAEGWTAWLDSGRAEGVARPWDSEWRSGGVILFWAQFFPRCRYFLPILSAPSSPGRVTKARFLIAWQPATCSVAFLHPCQGLSPGPVTSQLLPPWFSCICPLWGRKHLLLVFLITLVPEL